MARWQQSRTAKGHRSTFEDTISEQLDAAGVKYTYESKRIEWTRKVTSGHCLSCGHNRVGQRCHYTPDFIVQGPRGEFWIEVKGKLDSDDRTKHKAIKEQHPDIDIRFLFQRDNPIPGTKEKTRYSAWATKCGFKWAVKKIPEEWLR